MTHKKGTVFESLALQFLRAKGLQLVQQNFHSRYGEIDLIMRDGSCLVFIEVRARSSQQYGHAAETVGRSKQRKIVTTAMHYLQRNSHAGGLRFDVVAIHNDSTPPGIEWITDAFEGEL